MSLRSLSKNPRSPLRQALNVPGARVLLYCAACGWSKTYAPKAILQRLVELRRGDEWTSVGEVARLVQWPCPACRRMRWGARFLSLEDGWVDERDARKRAVRLMRS